MHVIATAGHVDHGKSTLVRALTGMEPDRWAEERRRGLTIDLGFAWTDLPSGETAAFVDVPGHERYVPNMLAGIGPAPAVLFVVAAYEGWLPKSAEHLAALHALGVRHGLLAVTRTDLADPADAIAQARAALAATSLRGIDTVTVSAPGGVGMGALRTALDRLVASLPAPDTSAPVRLWVDRVFTIHGSGTVVTGTLPAGRLDLGDNLELARTGRTVQVRGLQSLGAAVPHVRAVARVAVNLRGVDRRDVRRGDTLLTPGRFHLTDLVDVRLAGDEAGSLPPEATLHFGSAAITAGVRPLGADTVRLRLSRSLPLHLGDRALLRDPGRHHIAGAVTVLDVDPSPLTRRGAAARRAAVLAAVDRPDEIGEIRRRRLVTRAALSRMGLNVTTAPVAGDWLAEPAWWQRQRDRLRQLVEAHTRDHPLDPAMPVEALRRALDLPDRALVIALVTPPLAVADGRIGPSSRELPARLREAVDALRAYLAAHPFRAPSAERLAEAGLGPRELAAVERAGELIRIADGIVLATSAPHDAIRLLVRLPQPFTLSEARQALDTNRRTAIPLLEYLDRTRLTRRLPDDRRTVQPHDQGVLQVVETP